MHLSRALNILDKVLVEVGTSALGGSKGGSGLPLGGSTGSSLLHHLVDLLQRQALGLGDEEVGVDKSASAKSTPDEEYLGLQVTTVLTDHVGGDDCNDGVPEPVGGGRQTDATGADGERENFTNDDPGARTPGGGKEEDEDGDKRNLGVDSTEVVGSRGIGILSGRGGVDTVETSSDTDNGDEELADQHAERADKQDRAATELFDSIEGQRSGQNVDDGEDHGGEEDVLDGAG